MHEIDRNLRLKKHGFMVLELLIAMTLTALLSFLVCNSALSLYRGLLSAHKLQHAEAMLATALERCLYDLRTAPSSTVIWKRCDPDYIIWQQGDTDTGWRIVDGTLQRISGQYTVADGTWQKSTTSKAAHGVAQGTFTITYNYDHTAVASIGIFLKSSSSSVVRSAVTLRNRELI